MFPPAGCHYNMNVMELSLYFLDIIMALCLGFKGKVLIDEVHTEVFTDEIVYLKIL